jgi:hypothetical protein
VFFYFPEIGVQKYNATTRKRLYGFVYVAYWTKFIRIWNGLRQSGRFFCLYLSTRYLTYEEKKNKVACPNAVGWFAWLVAGGIY